MASCARSAPALLSASRRCALAAARRITSAPAASPATSPGFPVASEGWSTGRSLKGAFPSLTISKDGVTAAGSFAQRQAEFLHPDQQTVSDLSKALKENNIGVVSHFYMDAELQGTLVKVHEEWEHVFCADSLAMGFAAVEMAKKGVKAIACLGVDFMSESVKACLNQNGFHDVPVFRLKAEHIGCTLAASAEQRSYEAYLTQASKLKNPLHVVYINTSLETKAKTHNIIPTITCTSSNVVKTILQAADQMPDVSICYGPDTYMGENLQQLFQGLLVQGDAAIQRLHPKHNVKTVEKVLSNFHFFKQGICVVHHMFGGDVTEKIRTEYDVQDPNTYYTAHFEVPGEMFKIASEAAATGKGVIGSTSNILDFITGKCAEPFHGAPKRFILGTESGMITSVVRGVQGALTGPGAKAAEVEIIFPVASEAVAQTGEEHMKLVPGVKGGEGCSLAGGCATCPFMKMNDLDSLMDLVTALPATPAGPDSWLTEDRIPARLRALCARVPADGITKDGYNLIDGTLPIAFMNRFMGAGQLPDELVERVLSMQGEAGAYEAMRGCR